MSADRKPPPFPSAKGRSASRRRVPQRRAGNPSDAERCVAPADLSRRARLSRPLLRALVAAGHLDEAAAAGRAPHSAQDLVVIRMAAALRAARVSTAGIVEALTALRAEVGPGEPLAARRLPASSRDGTVRKGS